MGTLTHVASPFEPVEAKLPHRAQPKSKAAKPAGTEISQLAKEYRRIQGSCQFCLLGAPH